MAVKDHSLDDKIIKAAWDEFMEKGFQNGSLHKIADRAGITTGALYTRYKNKDDLFYSLTKETIEIIQKRAEPLREMYYSAEEDGSLEELFRVIACEKKVYLDILFEYYEECKLLFCRSMGSSLEKMIDKMMQMKVQETVAYVERFAKKPIDLNGVEMIISSQLHFYQMILEKDYCKEEAFSCMDTVNLFFEAGWRTLFEKSE